MEGCFDEWMNGCVDGRWMGGWMEEGLFRWADGWMSGRMNGG